GPGEDRAGHRGPAPRGVLDRSARLPGDRVVAWVNILDTPLGVAVTDAITNEDKTFSPPPALAYSSWGVEVQDLAGLAEIPVRLTLTFGALAASPFGFTVGVAPTFLDYGYSCGVDSIQEGEIPQSPLVSEGCVLTADVYCVICGDRDGVEWGGGDDAKLL